MTLQSVLVLQDGSLTTMCASFVNLCYQAVIIIEEVEIKYNPIKTRYNLQYNQFVLHRDKHSSTDGKGHSATAEDLRKTVLHESRSVAFCSNFQNNLFSKICSVSTYVLYFWARILFMPLFHRGASLRSIDFQSEFHTEFNLQFRNSISRKIHCR